MKIEINGGIRDTEAENLGELCKLLELEDVKIATAVNGEFVAADSRMTRTLSEGDKIEILTPRQGG